MKQLKNFKSNDSAKGFEQGSDPIFNEAVQKYGGMGEDELINQLLQSVRTARANGTYNPTQMNTYLSMLKSHISDEQYNKLNNIINIINNENV